MIWALIFLWLVITIATVHVLHLIASRDSLVSICDQYIEEHQSKDGDDFWISYDSWELWSQANIKGVL